ncbi:protein of unknown function [Acidithiobacillus ferrivorans]|uniref:Uncharacterized protein n=1 Tax=Acidithiobacillus ferrivorans TaxID=160808 RepID=A0ABY1MR46_9PROT|nr:protein of unknown function [Acidithiobacillus ferrivorans]
MMARKPCETKWLHSLPIGLSTKPGTPIAAHLIGHGIVGTPFSENSLLNRDTPTVHDNKYPIISGG